MWFDMVKNHGKKSFKIVICPITANSEEILIAKTDSHGFAIDIARHFDEKYEGQGLKVIIEIR